MTIKNTITINSSSPLASTITKTFNNVFAVEDINYNDGVVTIVLDTIRDIKHIITALYYELINQDKATTIRFKQLFTENKQLVSSFYKDGGLFSAVKPCQSV